MNLDIFQSTKNWTYSGNDVAAQPTLAALAEHARKNLPKGFFDRNAPLSLAYMRGTQLYGCLQTLPKGALHNVMLDCCDDIQFYRQVIAHEPTVHVTSDFRSFRIAPPEHAAAQGWLNMEQARGRFAREEEFVEAIAGITLLTAGEIGKICREEATAWQLMAKKVSNSATLLYASHIFPKFIRHVLRKFIANGYSRVEFRAELLRLSRYDSQGNFVEKLPYAAYTQLFDQALAEVTKQHPAFSAGVIFCLRKSKTPEEIESALERVCSLGWERAVGVDFLQEDGQYGSIEQGNRVVDAVLSRHPNVRLRKVYHAGETRDFKSRNIEQAVAAGSVRIGHGLNVMQRIEFLPYCRFLCFEKCPLANLLLGHTGDPRESSAPILLGLGYAVSISLGDAGKLGAEDCTADFFVTLVSYDWTLKHLKLAALHSINHSLQTEGERSVLLKDFEKRWEQWADKLLAGAHNPTASRPKELDFFTTTSNWQFSAEDEQATRRFEAVRLREISHLPKSYFGKNTMAHLEHMRSTEMYKILKTVPKGVLHHDHLDCNEDDDFYLNIVMADPNVYLAADRKSFKIGPKAQAEREGWVSWAQLRAEIPNEKRRVGVVSNLTMLSKEELAVVAGEQHDFWVLFEQKIGNFFPIVFCLHIFKKYVRHTLLKFIANGYERVEFRALLCQLTEYDSEGNFVKLHDEGEYMRAFDEVYDAVVQEHPHFSAAFIFFGLKVLSEEDNFKLLDKACSYGWPKHVGIDFVQQEDPFGSMEPYVRVGDRIVKKYAHMHLKKAYHAGETKDHLNNNVELAVRSGAVRVGHGLNIFKRVDYLSQCRHVCFELNPISNLLTGGMADIRMSPAPLLLGLGYPVSISSDDPGKFGYEDTTVDYFAAAICFNWTLKHLKLVAYHSINHAIVTEGERIRMLENFNLHWKQWITDYLKSEQQSDGPQLTHVRNGSQNMRLLAARINSFERT